MTAPLGRRLPAEAVGCFFPFAAVVGSSIMTKPLAGQLFDER